MRALLLAALLLTGCVSNIVPTAKLCDAPQLLPFTQAPSPNLHRWCFIVGAHADCSGNAK